MKDTIDRFNVWPRTEGKSYYVMTKFIERIKQGKKAICFGPNYVVMDMKTYNKLVAKTDFQINEDHHIGKD